MTLDGRHRLETPLILHDNHLVAALLNGNVEHFVIAAFFCSFLPVIHLVDAADMRQWVVSVDSAQL